MVDGTKEYSLENVRLRITRMALMLGMKKEHSLENGRLRITRMARMLDGRKEYSLENTRLRITQMERMWATRILVWGYLGDYAPPLGEGTGEGPAVECGFGASWLFTHLVITLLGCLFHPFLIARQPWLQSRQWCCCRQQTSFHPTFSPRLSPKR